MKIIQLSRGKIAFVDDEDFEALQKFKWSYSGKYAVRNLPLVNGKKGMVYMHREILQTPVGMDTDHRSGDRLDNRRSNLRVATRSENLRNRGKQLNNKTGSKGVCWNKQSRKFHAQIRVHGKKRHLGLFRTVAEAALAYINAARQLHGDFSRF